MASYMESHLQLDLSLEHELEHEGTFSALVAANHKWLGHYARMHATFSVEHTMLERNSIWMNAYFQKTRMITSPWSKQGELTDTAVLILVESRLTDFVVQLRR